ncbi:hypothetical protein M0802_001073 [Mischocyttarus mexicanus]|nr:hypothetical protein M0802_001073 [Mischocyttarus mexicanus]
MKDSRDDTKRKAPDGGWGWFVCLGSSLISLSLRSLDPSFGLLFQDLLEELNIESTGTSVIMSVLDAVVNFSGLFVGPLLKKYSYRKVAFFGSLLSCIGLMLTSRADSMPYLICTYSILGAIYRFTVGFGTGIAIASAFVALNTFFDKKRGQAVGFSMAGTTLAMMLVPQLVHILLGSYGFRGTMMIISAWALHSVVGACLLRSVETQKETSIPKKITEPKEKDALLKRNSTSLRKLTNSTNHENTDGRRRSETNVDSKIIEIVDDGIKKKGTIFDKIKKTFDLDLLKDTIYLNVVVGTSLYYVAESNFKLMTPFFLSSIGMTKAEVAFCLSLTAFTDILARLTLPTVFDKLGLKKRSIFWICSIMVGFGRSGFLRGATLVNLNLSISECCSLKKLPSAFGIFMVCKGIFVVAMSPLIESDRGWAWMVLLGATIINFSILPIQQCYGLIFGERFASLGITATQASLILHLNSTICCSIGLINGPMMKKFSFRTVAISGGFLIACGICGTAFALTLPLIILCYCVIIGMGQGMIYSATNLATNTYFKKKRNTAMSLSITLSGFGPIIMPLLIVKCLEEYATKGTLLIFTGIAANAFVGACLLKPFLNKEQIKSKDFIRKNNMKQTEAVISMENNDIEKYVAGRPLLNNLEQMKVEDNLEQINEETKTTDKKCSFFKKISTNLDLELLKDLRYILIVTGMAVSIIAETNFNALIPFVLEEVSGLKINKIGTVMSIQGAFDITGRLIVPLIAEKAHWNPRYLFVVSLFGSTLGRTILCNWGDDYPTIIVVAIILGIAKGTRAVFQTLIIPDYIPLERLPTATGIQMVCQGILSIILGPTIGMVHDLTGSYISSMYFTSGISVFCVFLWLFKGLWSPLGCHNQIKTNENTTTERNTSKNRIESQEV